MKLRKMTGTFMALCFLSVGIFANPDTACAKGLTSERQAQQKALDQVKNATVTEVDTDRGKDGLVYEVELVKGTKEFKLTYRASDGKLIAYEWEEHQVDRFDDSAKLIGEERCRELAEKKVPGAQITAFVQKYDDGVAVYKVKMKKDDKKYELKFHAGTGQLMEYEWKYVPAKSSADSYIGIEKAKSIALGEVPGATVTKAKLDKDDGVAVYEVELYKGGLEYEFTIDAKTGKILEMDIDD